MPHALIVSLVLAHVAFSANRITLMLLAIHLQASAFTVGLVMSLMMVVPMLLAVTAGRWADRAGFKPPTLIGQCAMLVGGLLPGLMPTLPMVYASSVLTGCGYMLAHIAVNSAIGVRAGSERVHAFGLLALGFSVSGTFGPLLAGLLIDHAGHAASFLAMMLFPAAAAVLLLRRGGAGGALSAAHAAAAPPQDQGTLIELLRMAPLRAVFIVTGMMSMGWDMFTFLAPLQGTRIGLSATAIGGVVGAFGAGAFAVRLAMPWIMRRLSEWQTMSVTLGVTAVCYLAFPFAGAAGTLITLAFVLGVSLGCGQPIGMSLLHQATPAHRTGEAVGIRSAITSASQTLLPLLFGALGTALGLVPVFWTAATILASGGAFAGRHRRAAP